MSVEKQSILDRILGGGRNRQRVSPTDTIGASGTPIYGGFIDENETNSNLTGRQKYVTYSNILVNTSIVASGVRFFLNLIAKPKWKAEPAQDTSSDARAEEFAQMIEEMMSDMDTPWRRIVRRTAMFSFYGYSIQEWTAKRREDGFFGLQDIAPRPQITIERWDVDENGVVMGVTQRNPQTQADVYLPRDKLIYAVDDTLNDSPEGLGLFRSLVDSARRLARYEQLEGYGFETDLRGIPIGRVPYQALEVAVSNNVLTREQATAATAALESFIKQHIKNPQLGILLDSKTYEGNSSDGTTVTANRQWDVELMSGDGGNFEAVATAIERINHEMARVLGVENMLLGQSRGTQSLSKDKSNNLFMVIDSTLAALTEVYQKDFVERIFDLNGWDKEFMPTLSTGKVQFRDIEEITTALNDMASAGAVLAPDDPAINEVRELLGLSPQPELTDEELARDALPGTPPPDDQMPDEEEEEEE